MDINVISKQQLNKLHQSLFFKELSNDDFLKIIEDADVMASNEVIYFLKQRNLL